jgi:Uncharacterized protein conserved in bacteria (DUF2252)
MILLEGEGAGNPMFLQVKEAQPSVLAGFMPDARLFASEGERVVVGQRLIQGSPNIFLGWGRGVAGRARDFYVRQLADMKGSLDIVENDRSTLAQLASYAALCGWALALAHAKSGDAALIAGYCGRGDALPHRRRQAASRWPMPTRPKRTTQVSSRLSGRGGYRQCRKSEAVSDLTGRKKSPGIAGISGGGSDGSVTW